MACRADARAAAAANLLGYIRALLAIKRYSPGADLLSALAAIRDGEDRLTEDELTSMAALLLIAGHETTVNLIGSGVLTLLEHPAQLALLRAEPTRITQFVEETLRFEGPVQVAPPRYAAEKIELGDVIIAAGDTVVPALFAANRDPVPSSIRRSFTRSVQPTRTSPSVTASTTASAPHWLGSKVGAFDRLFARFPNLRLAVPADQLALRSSVLLHGLDKLPATLR